MSRFGRIRRRPDHWPTPHARARARAAERLDGPLGLAETSWLDEHLSTCRDCSRVAASYEADRLALRSLRSATPEPPRDLWARTAAAMEREAGAARPTAASRSRGARPPLAALSGLAVAVVGLAVGAVSMNLFQTTPDVAIRDTGLTPSAVLASASVPSPSEAPPTAGPDPTPLLANAGDVTWIRRSADGRISFANAPIEEVCPAETQSGCATLDETAEEVFDLSAEPKSIIGSPVDDQAVVISDDGEGGDEIVVVRLPERGFPPRQTSEPASTPTPTPGDTPTPEATPSAAASPTPAVTEPATPTPAETTPTPTSEPTDTATSSPTPEPEPEVTPAPILTPGPSLALADDITLVGQSAAFSPDGTWFAFTARPTDGSRGPDVYLWNTGDEDAQRVTDDGASTLAGWVDGQIIVSRPADAAAVDGAAAVSVAIDPTTGEETAIEGSLWRPAVDPGGTRAVAWVGDVAFDGEGVTWRPATGSLELLAWPPTAAVAEPQVLLEGPFADVDIRWDETGEWVAVWVADSLESEIGRLSLFRVDSETGLLDDVAEAPTEVSALAGFSIGDGRLAWVGPAGQDGEGSHIHVAAWIGRDVGTAESVPGQGIVVVR